MARAAAPFRQAMEKQDGENACPPSFTAFLSCYRSPMALLSGVISIAADEGDGNHFNPSRQSNKPEE